MIYTGNLNDVNSDLTVDEIWYVVRSIKPFKQISGVISKHVPVLSPSLDLFLKKEKYRKKCMWNKKTFDTWFKPLFLKEIINNSEAMNLINELSTTDKRILLVCYCEREDMCHRSILKELINKKAVH